MRAAFWLLALFTLAVALTLAARVDQGYVVIVFPPWRMELSFLLALFLLVGLMALVYTLLGLARTALRLPDDLRAWHARRLVESADRALCDAVRAHLDGDAVRAARLAQRARTGQAPDIAERLIAAAGELPPAGFWQRLKDRLGRAGG